MKRLSHVVPLVLALAIAPALPVAPAAAQSSNNNTQSNGGQGDAFSDFLASIFGTQQATDQTLDNDWNQGERPFAQRRPQVEARIAESLASGAIGRAEADAVRRQYESIVDTEARYAANGGITDAERSDLRARYRAMIDQVNDSRAPQGNGQQGGAYQSIAAQRTTFDTRINQALQQRRISTGEAQRLRSDFQGLTQLEASYRRNGLDTRETADLEARFDSLERRLNESGFGNDVNSVRWSSFESRIVAAERSGALQRRDAAQLRTEIGDLSRLDTAYAANGFNNNEREYLRRRHAEVEARVGYARR